MSSPVKNSFYASPANPCSSSSSSSQSQQSVLTFRHHRKIPRTPPQPSEMALISPVCPSRLRYIPHSLAIFLLISSIFVLQTVHAAPSSKVPDRRTVPVGAVFTIDAEGADRPGQPTGFPSWARLNDTSGQIYGIPQAKDVGLYQIPLKGMPVPVEVVARSESNCGESGQSTTWLEVARSQRFAELSMEDQFRAAQSLSVRLGVRLADLRVFPYAYLRQYRIVMETIHQMEGPEELDAEERAMLTMNISCGALTDQASEVINAAAENGLNFQVVQGQLTSQAKGPEPVITKPAIIDKGQSEADSGTFSALPLIIFALLLAIIILVAVFWALSKRAKSGRGKQTDANGKANAANNAGGAGTHHQQLASPNDSTTPMLDPKGNARDGGTTPTTTANS